MYVEKQMSPVQIAEKLGASPSGVYLALKRHGISTRSSKEAALIQHGKSKLPWKRIAKEYRAGDSCDVLGERYGVANSTITYHLRRMGEPVRPKGLPKGVPSGALIEFDVDAAIKLNKDGKTLTEIAEELGVSYGTLQYRLRSVGYSPRRDLRSKSEISKNYQFHKRKVVEAVGEVCAICGESRCIDLAHIAPKKDGNKLVPENAVPLCPTHHRLFDRGKLNEAEFSKIANKLRAAKKAGYVNSFWGSL